MFSLKPCHFDKNRRLTKQKDYESVFKKANKISTSEFIVLHQKNTVTTARLGLAISKKILPKAYQRNRIKRLLRESFRKQNLPFVDIIFLAKKGIAERENKFLFKKMSLIWNKLTVFYTHSI